MLRIKKEELKDEIENRREKRMRGEKMNERGRRGKCRICKKEDEEEEKDNDGLDEKIGV